MKAAARSESSARDDRSVTRRGPGRLDRDSSLMTPDMDWLQLHDKTAIVTGGASGIGKAVAHGLAAVGVHVLIADIDGEAAERVASEIGQTHGGTHGSARTDVSERASVEEMVRRTLELTGRVDILVNNAGINIPRLLVDPAGAEELTTEIWDRTCAINQRGAFLCAQAVARTLLESRRSGVIVNMASESGLEGSEGQSAYAATKAALHAMTRSWAKELGKHGIRVVGLAPGILEVTGLRTEAYEKSLAYTRGITVEALRAAYEKQSIPLGRVGALAEVADAVVYLASSRASYIHGTVVNVSGGKSRG